MILGQHVMPGSAGQIRYRPGTTQAAADSLQVRLFGRGAHGSMPESSVDPVVMAAATVMRLQTIVSRETAASQAAVVTIGALQAGTKDHVIPEEAVLKINVRSFDEAVRRHTLDAIERIVNAEALASGAPKAPDITTTEHYPLTVNDAERTGRVAAALRAHFGQGGVAELGAPRRLPLRPGGRARGAGHPHQPQPGVRPRAAPHPRDGVEAMVVAALDALGA